MDKRTTAIITNYLIAFFNAKQKIDDSLTLDEQEDLLNHVTRIEVTLKLEKVILSAKEAEKEINPSSREGKLISNFISAYRYHKASKHIYSNRETYPAIGDKSIAITFALVAFFNLFSALVECVKLGRTAIILSAIDEIDISKTAQELNELDKRFNGFIKHNYFQSIDDFDIYPESLILQGKNQLNRVSLNYGKPQKERLPGQMRLPDESIEFPSEVFLKVENLKVFNYFIEHFGNTKRPVDLSQIYIWMEKKTMVKPRSGKIFRRLMVSEGLVDGRFAKLAPEKHDSQVFLTELFKKFVEITDKE